MFDSLGTNGSASLTSLVSPMAIHHDAHACGVECIAPFRDGSLAITQSTFVFEEELVYLILTLFSLVP